MSTSYYRAALDRATRFALYKLEQKRIRGIWPSDDLHYYLRRLREETGELELEIMRNDTSPREVAMECADIINFAAIILDVTARTRGEPTLPIRVRHHGQWMDGNRTLAKMWRDDAGEIWYEFIENFEVPALLAQRKLPADAEKMGA